MRISSRVSDLVAMTTSLELWVAVVTFLVMPLDFLTA